MANHVGVPGAVIVAFAVDTGAGSEQLVLFMEPMVEAPRAPSSTRSRTSSARRPVHTVHELHPHTIVLLPPQCIPRTAMGKVMRSACRQLFTSGAARSKADVWWSITGGFETGSAADHEAARRAEEEKALAVLSPAAREVAEQTVQSICVTSKNWADGRKPSVRSGVTELGLTSIDVMSIAGELARRLRRPVQAADIYRFPSIELLARHLTGEGVAASSAGVDIHTASPEECLSLFRVAVSERWCYSIEDAAIVTKVCPRICLAVTVGGAWAGGVIISLWPYSCFEDESRQGGFGWFCMYFVKPEFRNSGAAPLLGQRMVDLFKRPGFLFVALPVQHVQETYVKIGALAKWPKTTTERRRGARGEPPGRLRPLHGCRPRGLCRHREDLRVRPQRLPVGGAGRSSASGSRGPATSPSPRSRRAARSPATASCAGSRTASACPLYADSKAVAVLLLLACANTYGAGCRLGFSPDMTNEEAVQILQEFGFQKCPFDEECVRMYYNGVPQYPSKKLFGSFRGAFGF